eukprot:19678_1
MDYSLLIQSNLNFIELSNVTTNTLEFLVLRCGLDLKLTVQTVVSVFGIIWKGKKRMNIVKSMGLFVHKKSIYNATSTMTLIKIVKLFMHINRVCLFNFNDRIRFKKK